MSLSDEVSDRIATSFGQAASIYHAQAGLQKHCAQRLLNLLSDSLEYPDLPSGPVLEIGCGTGFITELLCDRLLRPEGAGTYSLKLGQGRDYYITDLSAEMVQFCCDRLQPKLQKITSNHPFSSFKHPRSHFFFQVLNAENIPPNPPSYSLIIGGFVAQWFQDIEGTIQKLLDRLQPHGRLLLSFPGYESFPEWRQQCSHLNLPFTAHPLPNPTLLLQTLSLPTQDYQVQVKTEWYPTYYESAATFFQSMKGIGAGLSQANIKLTARQMRQLLREWQPLNLAKLGHSAPEKLEVNYQIVYLLIVKP
ncbi:MAG: methyltransferase domain-containing protein [Leptolyngbyaceae bacterium]|nr:methyltransferase domain-containing protein [Leptolyngbyaceae bacterium]